MCRIDKRSPLPSLLVVAALAFAQGICAQTSTQTPAPATKPWPVVTLPPQPPPTPEEIGDAYMAQQRYHAAIEAYKKSSRKSATLENKLGIAYQMMLDTGDAMRCYERSLKLDPRNASVINNLGTIFDSQKEYAAAEKMYPKALKVNPQSALIQKNLGNALIAQHKYKKGWQAYEAALAIDPQVFERSNGPKVDNPSTVHDRGAMNYYLAKSYARAGMNERAIEYLRMAINEGFTTPRKVVQDSEFASLRGIPAFEQMIAAQRSP